MKNGCGFGYAYAQDYFCTLADQMVLVRAERARYFGPEYVDSDFGVLALRVGLKGA